MTSHDEDELYNGKLCFECRRSIEKYDYTDAINKDCSFCNSIIALTLNNTKEAEILMRDAIIKIHPERVVSAHSVVRNVLCNLRLHSELQPIDGKAIYSNTSIQILTENDFFKTWKNYISFKSNQKTAELKKLWDLMVDTSKAIKKFGSGKELEEASKKATQSDVMNTYNIIVTKRKRAMHGKSIVLSQSGGKISSEAAAAICLKKDEEIAEADSELSLLMESNEYKLQQSHITDYNKYLKETGIGELTIKKNCIKKTAPSPGMAFEKEIFEKVREKTQSLFEQDSEKHPDSCFELLHNISFAQLRMPERVTGEFDICAVQYKELLVDIPLSKAKKKRLKEGESFGEQKVVRKVEKIIAIYEVKMNPADILPAMRGHRKSIEFLSSVEGVFTFLDKKNDHEYTFTGNLFSEKVLGEHPTTFVTLSGSNAVVQGRLVPRNMCFPNCYAQPLLQHFLDVYPDDYSAKELSTNFGYLPHFYENLGDFLNSEDSTSMKTSLISSIKILMDAADCGKILVAADPFSGCYPKPFEASPLPSSQVVSVW